MPAANPYVAEDALRTSARESGAKSGVWSYKQFRQKPETPADPIMEHLDVDEAEVQDLVQAFRFAGAARQAKEVRLADYLVSSFSEHVEDVIDDCGYLED